MEFVEVNTQAMNLEKYPALPVHPIYLVLIGYMFRDMSIAPYAMNVD